MSEKKKTEADLIWDKIKDLSVNIYGLKNQTIEKHVFKKNVPGNVLYLKAKSPAIVAHLGEAIGEDYAVDVTESNYITIKKISKVLLNNEDEYIDFPRPNGKIERIKK